MYYKLREKIRQPFWSAGQKFGWSGPGVTLNISHFQKIGEEDKILFFVQSTGIWYAITKASARKISKEHNSKKRSEAGDPCIVLPLEWMEQMNELPEEYIDL